VLTVGGTPAKGVDIDMKMLMLVKTIQSVDVRSIKINYLAPFCIIDTKTAVF
jgi:hypothetical protein